jgi:hypothetical protein
VKRAGRNPGRNIAATMAEKSSSAAPTEDIPREIRSALLEYDDDKNENKEEYTYEPIPSDRKQIRLLRLYPGVPRSPQVMCEMFDAEFIEGQILPVVITAGNRTGKKIEYEALSWRWGDGPQPLHNHDRQERQNVQETFVANVGPALKYIRRTEDRIP